VGVAVTPSQRGEVFLPPGRFSSCTYTRGFVFTSPANGSHGYRLTTDCKDLWIHPHPTLRTLHPDVLGLPRRGHSFTLYTMRKHVGISPSLQGGPSFLLHPTTQRHWLAPTFLKGEESLGISPFRIDLLDRKALAIHRKHSMRLEVKTNNFPPWLHLDIPSAGVFPIAWDQEKLQPCFPVTMLQTSTLCASWRAHRVVQLHCLAIGSVLLGRYA